MRFSIFESEFSFRRFLEIKLNNCFACSISKAVILIKVKTLLKLKPFMRRLKPDAMFLDPSMVKIIVSVFFCSGC